MFIPEVVVSSHKVRHYDLMRHLAEATLNTALESITMHITRTRFGVSAYCVQYAALYSHSSPGAVKGLGAPVAVQLTVVVEQADHQYRAIHNESYSARTADSHDGALGTTQSRLRFQQA